MLHNASSNYQLAIINYQFKIANFALLILHLRRKLWPDV